MGRRRTKNLHLPPRVYERHGGLHYIYPNGRSTRIAAKGDLVGMYRALAAINAAAAPVNTIEQLAQRYCIEELTQKAGKTQRGRLQEFKPIIKAFGKMSAEEIEPHHVWQYFQVRGKTEQSRHEIRALSALLTFARRVGARKTANPCFGLQLPTSRPRDRYVTDEEYIAVRELAPEMIALAMDLALITGADQATIRTLERRNLTDDGILFERSKTFAKTKTPQLIEWNEELRLVVDALKRMRPEMRRVLICNRKGQSYSSNGFQSQWQRVMRKAKAKGIEPFHFHDLRAKSASDGADDQEAADRLGHGDPRLTRKVYRRLPRRAKALSILDKVQNIGQGKKS